MTATAAASGLAKSLPEPAPLGAIASGLAAALAPRHAGKFAYPCAALCGFCAGIAAEIDIPEPSSAAGAAFAAFLFAGLTYALIEKLDSISTVARRVLGAWVAAIGLLIGALTLLR